MNNRVTRATLTASLLGLALASTAAAQQDKRPPSAEGAVRSAMADHFFERMDTDKDGRVTRAEAEAIERQLFDRIDANKDGAITRQESEEGTRALRAKELEMRFKALDGNADGRLTQPESKLPPAIFDRLDQDKDHALTQAEFLAQPDRRAKHRELEFEQADTNHDGKVTRGEAAERAKQRFERADANHDGVITRAELDADLAKLHARGEPPAGGSHP